MAASEADIVGWQIWIDLGSIFIDLVAREPGGGISTLKLLSGEAGPTDVATLTGIRCCLGLGPQDPVPSGMIDAVRLGCRAVADPVVAGGGDPVVLAVTQGFSDLFSVNPHVVRLVDVPPPPRRSDSGGGVLDIAAITRGLEHAWSDGLRSLAVILRQSSRYPEHERLIGRIAKDIGFSHVSCSHEACVAAAWVGRGRATVTDAAVTPLLRRYADFLSREIPGARLFFTRTRGGVVDARRAQGTEVLSPCVLDDVMRIVAPESLNHHLGIEVDAMATRVFRGSEPRGPGGGDPDREEEVSPVCGHAVWILTGQDLNVAGGIVPTSLGPACHGRGGPLTLSDAAVMTGRLIPDLLPSVFGVSHDAKLDDRAVRRGFSRWSARLGGAFAPEQLADHGLYLALTDLAETVLQLGGNLDDGSSKPVLSCFGELGGMFVCRLADLLDVETAWVPPLAGGMPAHGPGSPRYCSMRQLALELPFDSLVMPRLNRAFADLEAIARCDLDRQGIERSDMRGWRSILLRYQGLIDVLEIEACDGAVLLEAFHRRHQRRFGFSLPGHVVVIEAVRVGMVADDATADDYGSRELPQASIPKALGCWPLFGDGEWHDAPAWSDLSLMPGTEIDGPARIIGAVGQLVVEPGWSARRSDAGRWELTRNIEARRLAGDTVAPAFPVMRARYAPRRMLTALARRSPSLHAIDGSAGWCALFDLDGDVLASAIRSEIPGIEPAISMDMGELAAVTAMGDAVLVRAGANGQSEVILPVCLDGIRRGYAVSCLIGEPSRRHGQAIMRLPWDGAVSAALEARLTSGASPQQRAWDLADLRAQLAAGEVGVALLHDLGDRYGADMIWSELRRRCRVLSGSPS